MFLINNYHAKLRALEKHSRACANGNMRFTPIETDPVVKTLVRSKMAVIDDKFITEDAVKSFKYH